MHKLYALITPEELYNLKDDPDLIILDTTFKSRIKKEGCKVIPNAIFMDLQHNFVDKDSSLPNTIPDIEHFQQEARNLGINNTSKIVAYDQEGIYTSPRAWWLFKAMGHQNIAVLNGGLPAWAEANFPLSDKHTLPHAKGNFEAIENTLTVDMNDISKNIQTGNFTVIDARSSGRFKGKDPEPRAGLRGGHIPGSLNLPYTEVLDNGSFKSQEELTALFKSKEVNDKPIAFSCGSGITACIILMAASMVTNNKLYLYDGSWTEWATNKANNTCKESPKI